MQPFVRRRWIVAAVLVVGGLLAAWGLQRSSQPRINLLIVTLDTTRADRLGAWNGPAGLTPVLDQLAGQSCLFETAYAPVPLTLPSHASLMTGLYPPEHGLRVNNGIHRLGPDIPVLAEQLKRRGYATGAFLGGFVLDHKFGLDRGFDVYDDTMEELHGPSPEDAHSHRMRIGERVVDAALHWLGRRNSKTFFCWVHLFDPHVPYSARKELFGERYRDRPYDAGIAYVDRQVGRLLEYLKRNGLDENTIIVVAGDHGESLGEHGERSHGFTVYNATLHVPLMIRWTGENAPARRIASPVSLVDVYPTLMSALAPDQNVSCSGRNLRPACFGEVLSSVSYYAESNHPFEEGGAAPLRCLVTDRWKYLRSPKPELYDLVADPHEEHNLVDEEPSQLADLERQLQDRESALVLREAPSVIPSDRDLRTLASLGYTGGGRNTTPDDVADLPDIKDALPYFNDYSDAQGLARDGELQRAAELFQRAVDALPNFFQAWYNLGYCRQQMGDLAAAEAAFKRAVEIDGNATAHVALAKTYLKQTQPEPAIPHLETASRLQPAAAENPFLLGEAYRMLGRWNDARQAYLDALALDPEFAPARQALEGLPDG